PSRFIPCPRGPPGPPSFPPRRSSDLVRTIRPVVRDADVERLPLLDGGDECPDRLLERRRQVRTVAVEDVDVVGAEITQAVIERRSEEHTSELHSRENLVCRLLLEKKK